MANRYRFYVDWVHGDTAFISDAGQFHHLKDVLRLKIRGAVIVCDGDGREYTGTVAAIKRKQAVIKVTPSMPARHNEMKLTVACAIPKGARLDDVIDQLTQLGAARIIPMMTERAVVKLDETKKEARLRRWRKIAQNAARQSQRNLIPLIEPVTNFASVISQSGRYDLKLIPNLEGRKKLIRDVLAAARPEEAMVLIGPEGDFTPAEVRLAVKAGFIPVSLGNTVLRVGTAAVAIASYFRLCLGE
jgi:16S rRNA (uracil1498-N3)-methyltransferase